MVVLPERRTPASQAMGTARQVSCNRLSQKGLANMQAYYAQSRTFCKVSLPLEFGFSISLKRIGVRLKFSNCLPGFLRRNLVLIASRHVPLLPCEIPILPDLLLPLSSKLSLRSPDPSGFNVRGSD